MVKALKAWHRTNFGEWSLNEPSSYSRLVKVYLFYLVYCRFQLNYTTLPLKALLYFDRLLFLKTWSSLNVNELLTLFALGSLYYYRESLRSFCLIWKLFDWRRPLLIFHDPLVALLFLFLGLLPFLLSLYYFLSIVDISPIYLFLFVHILDQLP